MYRTTIGKANRHTPSSSESSTRASSRTADLPRAHGNGGTRCACGGGCPRCKATPAIQAKMKVSQAGDALEQQADRAAAQAMQPQAPDRLKGVRTAMPAPALSRMASSSTAGDAPPIVHEVLTESGQSLDGAARGFFESRFGHNLDSVRVHTDGRAAESARAIDALAYTAGNDVVFDRGRYAPGTVRGRSLLAHELAHVVQQSGRASALTVQRSVNAANVHCTPHQANAVDDPVAALNSMDEYARDLALGASGALFLASFPPVASGPASAMPMSPGLFRTLFSGADSGRAGVLRAYRRRFGAPQAVTGGYRNRFTGAIIPSAEQVEADELRELSERFRQIYQYLTGPIRYFCRQNGVAFTMPPCGAATCHPGGALAYSCPVGNTRAISLCPDFWDNSLQGGGMNIVHEAVHLYFHARHHYTGSVRQRVRNPECYGSFIADLFDLPVAGGGCDAVPGVP